MAVSAALPSSLSILIPAWTVRESRPAAVPNLFLDSLIILFHSVLYLVLIALVDSISFRFPPGYTELSIWDWKAYVNSVLRM